MPTTTDQQGFTLVELLVVIMLIGILAAIALPSFLAQQGKAQDGKAKTEARHLVSYMETCYLDQQTYVGCSAGLGTNYQGIRIGTGVGETSVTGESSVGYSVIAVSKAGATRTFTIDHNVGGSFGRTCGAPGVGGCDSSGEW